jgi:hypothetical protein
LIWKRTLLCSERAARIVHYSEGTFEPVGLLPKAASSSFALA